MEATAEKTEEEGTRGASVFLAQVAGGALHAQFSEDLRDLGQTLLREATRRDAKVKGKLTLSLTFTASPGGLVEVGYDIKKAVPPPKTALGAVWITSAGNFVQENPRQLSMKLREVSAGPVREVGATATPASGT